MNIVVVLTFTFLLSCSSQMNMKKGIFKRSVVIMTKEGKVINGTANDYDEKTLSIIEVKMKKLYKVKPDEVTHMTMSKNFYDSERLKLLEKYYCKHKTVTCCVSYSSVGILGRSIIGGITGGLIDKNLTSIVLGMAISGSFLGGGLGNKSDMERTVNQVILGRDALNEINKS